MPSTSDNNKRIAKNTLLLYFRMLLTMSIGLYTSRIVLDTLGEVNFGIYNVVGGFVAMFAIISGAMTTASQRFISFEIGKGKDGNVQLLFSTTIIIHLILAGIVLVLAETVGFWFLNHKMNFPEDRYVAANWVFQFSLLTFIINIISVPYNAAIIAYEKMSAFAFVSILEVTLKLIFVYILTVLPLDKLIIYSIYLALIAIIVRIVYGYYCYRNFEQCRFNWKWGKTYRKEMMSFVSWNLIGSAAGISKEQGINILLNIFFGATVNAARGVAYQVFGAINGFVSNFQMALTPQIVKTYASEQKEYMYKLVFRGSKLSYLMLLTLSMPFIIEAPFILNLWLKKVPEYSSIFLRIVLITALIDSLSHTLKASMHASGIVRDFQIVVGGITLLTLPITYFVLKIGYPPSSAMFVSLGISICCHFARLLLLKKSISFPVLSFLTNVSLKVFIVSILSAAIPVLLYINMDKNWITSILIGVISIISSLLFSFTIGFDKSERLFFIDKIKRYTKIQR